MAGLAGWQGLTLDGANSVREAMAGILRRHDDSVLAEAAGEGWAAVAGRPRNAPAVVTEGEVTGVLYGDVRGPYARGRDPAELMTELCRAYAKGTTSFLAELEGAFAMAFLWPAANQLLLAADRVGIVPLYYAELNGGLAFATHQPALYEVPGLGTDIDYQAVYSFLHFHAIPSPQSVYKSVRRLMPGQALELREGRTSTTTFWQPEYRDERGRAGVSDLKPEFRAVIEHSVRTEAGLADHVGCFLSGGTDSSTVAGHLGMVTDAPARSYSIGFDEEGYDETGFARIAAKHFATDHHEYFVTPQDIVDLIPKLATYYGAPFGNSSVIPTYYCARMAKEQGIERLLGGDGGDELFGGNDRYAKQKVFGIYDDVPGWIKAILEPVVFGFPMGAKILPVQKARRYIEQAKVPMPARMETYNLMHWFRDEGLLHEDFEGAVDTDQPIAQLAEIYDGANSSTMMNRMLAMDLKFTLADNDIPKVSGMCELAGVEVGFPFMSDEMVEFSTRVPIDMKVKRYRLRHMFKEALRDFLPEEVITKTKHGFGLPFGVWAAREEGLRELVADSLSGFKQRGIVKPAFVDRLIDESRGTDAHYTGTLVWVFMILEHWFAEVHAVRQQRAR